MLHHASSPGGTQRRKVRQTASLFFLHSQHCSQTTAFSPPGLGFISNFRLASYRLVHSPNSPLKHHPFSEWLHFDQQHHLFHHCFPSSRSAQQASCHRVSECRGSLNRRTRHRSYHSSYGSFSSCGQRKLLSRRPNARDLCRHQQPKSRNGIRSRQRLNSCCPVLVEYVCA